MTNFSKMAPAAIVLGYAIGVVAYWPIALIAAGASVLIGYPWFGFILGFILDIAYGAPPGMPILHTIEFPFTAAVLAIIIVRYLVRRSFGGEYFDSI